MSVWPPAPIDDEPPLPARVYPTLGAVYLQCVWLGCRTGMACGGLFGLGVGVLSISPPFMLIGLLYGGVVGLAAGLGVGLIIGVAYVALIRYGNFGIEDTSRFRTSFGITAVAIVIAIAVILPRASFALNGGTLDDLGPYPLIAAIAVVVAWPISGSFCKWYTANSKTADTSYAKNSVGFQ